MSFLLDTNVISEPLKPKPDIYVEAWFKHVENKDLYISVLSLGEIRRGIDLLDTGKRKTQLLTWLEGDLLHWFGKRILPVDLSVAERWGTLSAHYRNLSSIDGLIASTALCHNLKLVTRNAKDFIFPGLDSINPWEFRN